VLLINAWHTKVFDFKGVGFLLSVGFGYLLFFPFFRFGISSAFL